MTSMTEYPDFNIFILHIITLKYLSKIFFQFPLCIYNVTVKDTFLKSAHSSI